MNSINSVERITQRLLWESVDNMKMTELNYIIFELFFQNSVFIENPNTYDN